MLYDFFFRYGGHLAPEGLSKVGLPNVRGRG